MQRIRSLPAVLLFLLIAACGREDVSDASIAPGEEPPAPAVIPAPVSTTLMKGYFIVTEETPVYAVGGGPDVLRIAHYFVGLLKRTEGPDLAVRLAVSEPAPGAIIFRLDVGASIEDEGYRIDVTPAEITVSASSPQGLFYGAVTLWQLMAPYGEKGGEKRIGAMRITDRPQFSWRGLMLDSARHYQPPEFIKEFIDLMALHKLNILHWHLTDDQAWRLEIKKYPRLTEVGAWRVPAGEGPAADIDPATGGPRLYGGYYTQAEVRDTVAYAAERFVTIVPEIEMPGHAQATIVAYPRLGVGARPDAVSSDWGVFPYVFNAEEETFTFLEDVLVEVMDLFPGAYIHIGGDEALKDQWKSSPRIRERMAALGVASEEALQGYFTRRMDDFLADHQRRLIGWDEILEGGLSANATVMSWRGAAGGVAAVAAGHDAVLAPWPDLYFDNRQSVLGDEPPGRGRVVSLKDVYEFNPYPESLGETGDGRIKGVQANIWTEHIRTSERVEWMTFPRAAALAEVAWSSPEAKDWTGFLKRLAPMLQRYDSLGVNYAPSAFSPTIEFAASPEKPDSIVLSLSNQARFGEIRYTLDASAPDASSAVFDKTITTPMPAKISAATFYGGVQMSPAASRIIDADSFLERADTELKPCTDKLVLFLEDDAPVEGPRATFLIDIMNPCWVFEGAPLDGAKAVEARVGQVPFNFQIGADREKIAFRAPKTPSGELEVRIDGCDGALIASLPLEPAAGNQETTTLAGALAPVAGVHDICFTFTADGVDPLWALDHVRFIRE